MNQKIKLNYRKTAIAIDPQYFYIKCDCYKGFHKYENNGNFRNFRKEIRYSKCPVDGKEKRILIRINKATKREGFEGYDNNNKPIFTEEEFDYKYEIYKENILLNLFK